MQEQQLNLELDVKSDASLSDFSGPGWTPIVDAVRQFHTGIIDNLFLYGNSGSGKSHLLSAICESFIEADRSAITLSLADLLYMDTTVLSSLETFEIIAIDDIDSIQGHAHWEEALFHLINRAKEQHKKMVFSANRPVSELSFSLLDLITRLSNATAYRVPDGHHMEDRSAILKAILRRRSWQFDERIVDYLLAEGPHSTGGMMQVLLKIEPMFSGLQRKSIAKSTIIEAMETIDELTLMMELEGIQSITQRSNIADLSEENISFNF